MEPPNPTANWCCLEPRHKASLGCQTFPRWPGGSQNTTSPQHGRQGPFCKNKKLLNLCKTLSLRMAVKVPSSLAVPLTHIVFPRTVRSPGEQAFRVDSHFVSEESPELGPDVRWPADTGLTPSAHLAGEILSRMWQAGCLTAPSCSRAEQPLVLKHRATHDKGCCNNGTGRWKEGMGSWLKKSHIMWAEWVTDVPQGKPASHITVS